MIVLMRFPLNRRHFLTALGMTSLSAPALGLDAKRPGSDWQSFDSACELIGKHVKAGVLKAAMLRVVNGGEVHERAFGVKPDAMFLIASITKPMTVTGAMVLADRLELSLSDPVMKFIPEFDEGDRRLVTIKHLMTHASGLPDQLPENNELRARHAPMEEFVKGAVGTPLLFKPGTRYKYQSMGILLLAEIVQRLSGKSIAEFLKTEVFTPLAMNRTVLGLGDYKLSDVVHSQTESAAPESGSGSADAKNWDWNSQYWRSFGAPWGGAHSTAKDVDSFLRSFLHPRGRVLRRTTARLMTTDHNAGLSTRRGLGFVMGPDGLGKSLSSHSFGHSGSTGTLAWADPVTDRSFVLLTSLPARKSRRLIINPVSDLLSV